MEAWELATVIVSLTAIFLVVVLVYVLTKLHSTIAQVESLIKKTNEDSIETQSVLRIKSEEIESEIPRILITLNYNEENNVELAENARMTFFGRL